MLTIDHITGLISLVQAGVVEIHPWESTIDHLEQPDPLIFDLDPGENVPWEVVIDAAYDVRDRLDPDAVQTTSLSETCCTGFHLSNEVLGRAFSRFVSGCRNSTCHATARTSS
jgi:bifunctional non-homologous end joining protein LigD